MSPSRLFASMSAAVFERSFPTPLRLPITVRMSSMAFVCEAVTLSLLESDAHCISFVPDATAISISRFRSRMRMTPFSASTAVSSESVIASASDSADFARRETSADASSAAACSLRAAGESVIAPASARAIFAEPNPMRANSRPSITSSAVRCPPFASRSAVPSAVHASVNFPSNSVAAPAIVMPDCFSAASSAPLADSFALRTAE